MVNTGPRDFAEVSDAGVTSETAADAGDFYCGLDVLALHINPLLHIPR